MGFEWVEVLDGYIRIATTEYDKPGTIVILLDGFGAIRAYHKCQCVFINNTYNTI